MNVRTKFEVRSFAHSLDTPTPPFLQKF